MTVTNDKRREVAAKVRETMGALGQVELDGTPLADLIEPEECDGCEPGAWEVVAMEAAERLGVADASCGEVFARHVGGPFGAEVESAGGEGLYRLRANRLTHTKPEPPDSWERLEDDATKPPYAYCVEHGLDDDSFPTNEKFARDLVRRARALAERSA